METAWFQEQKQETLRLTAEACRGSRIQAVSPDHYGLCICKDPNRTKTFASVLVFPQMFWASLDSANDSDDCEHLVKWSILRYRVNPIPMKGRRSVQQDARGKTSSTRPGGERRYKGWFTSQSFGERPHSDFEKGLEILTKKQQGSLTCWR